MTRILDWGLSKLVTVGMRPYPVVMKTTGKKLREYYDFLTGLGGWSIEEVRRYDREIKSNHELLSHVQVSLHKHLGKKVSVAPWNWRFAFYVIIRLIEPDVVVETGVEHGTSTTFALQALSENGRGRLYSIDLPDYAKLPTGKPPGWIIPDHLRDHWVLRLGPSNPILDKVLTEVGSLDIFLHDSEHSSSNMLWEFSKVFPNLRDNGILLCDDVEENSAFHEFAKSVGGQPLILSEWRSPRPRFAKFGGLMKKA